MEKVKRVDMVDEEVDFNYIYECMMGMFIEQDERFPSLFEDGMECLKLYDDALDARVRITEKIDGKHDCDNKDAMIIVNNYEDIMRIMCEAAFEHGKKMRDQ